MADAVCAICLAIHTQNGTLHACDECVFVHQNIFFFLFFFYPIIFFVFLGSLGISTASWMPRQSTVINGQVEYSVHCSLFGSLAL